MLGPYYSVWGMPRYHFILFYLIPFYFILFYFDLVKLLSQSGHFPKDALLHHSLFIGMPRARILYVTLRKLSMIVLPSCGFSWCPFCKLFKNIISKLEQMLIYLLYSWLWCVDDCNVIPIFYFNFYFIFYFIFYFVFSIQ